MMSAEHEVLEPILPRIHGPEDLRTLDNAHLNHLAGEIREELCRLSDHRAVHFASNLGVVELSIALHRVFDFSYDRLIWDTGHQCYPHKILTGRYGDLHTIRTRGGLMGFPNPKESPYDLMMTGHAGCSIGTALGLAVGDELVQRLNLPGAEKIESEVKRPERHSVAVIGDGAISSGVVFESMNHVGWLKKNMTVILNDNKMAICPRVGGVSLYLDRLRMAPSYRELKQFVNRALGWIPFAKSSARFFLEHLKSALKAGLIGGMFFEEIGFRYIGPIDGHNIEQLENMLRRVRDYEEPVLLHIFTEKGRGYRPAEQDPTAYHAPSPEVKKNGNGSIRGTEIADPVPEKTTDSGTQTGNAEPDHAAVKISSSASLESPRITETTTPQFLNPTSEPAEPSPYGSIHPYPPSAVDNDGDCEPNDPNSYTFWVREAVLELMREDPGICVITAAMCQGNMLEPIREAFPERFFDVGISESHAVVFAAGLAKSGMRPVVDIYSTFMQRGYDQIFQEASLQNLPILFLLDRAGLSGPDGPTHHGVFDITYCRPFPNLVLMSPGDPSDVEPMLRYAFSESSPTVLRYPKCTASPIIRPLLGIEKGKAEVLREGKDGMLLLYGGFLQAALSASEKLKHPKTGEKPLDFGVINARFAKPLDTETILAPLSRDLPLICVEEGMLAGGFGSAVLEAACDRKLDTRNLYRLGIPDHYVEHGERGELLQDLGLDENGILDACRRIARQ